MRCGAVFLFVVLAGAPLAAQDQAPPPAPRGEISNLDLLLGVHHVLHVADMITTGYDLTHGRGIVTEGNPMLRPFHNQPATLGVVSGALDIVEVMAIKSLARRHRKWAVVWSAALVATECWATINNINLAGEIQRARQRGR